MAPEQAAGHSGRVGPAADVYALGVILYELLAGRPPFLAETALETLLQVQSDEPVPPGRLRGKLPRDLETICLKCLQKEPQRRYASAQALADDLHRFLEGKPIVARPLGPLQRGWRWCRRNPLPVAVALSLLAGIAATSYFAVQADARAYDARIAQGVADSKANQAKTSAEEAQEARHHSDRRLYVSDLRLAQRAWEDARIERLLELLAGQRPEHTDGIDLRGFEWHYLWRLAHSELLTLPGCNEPPRGDYALLGAPRQSPPGGLAFSPDGTRLAAQCREKGIKVWDTMKGGEVLTIPVSGGEVVSLAFSPDGRRLAGACLFQDPQKGKTTGAVKLWDAISGQEVSTDRGDDITVAAVTFTANGNNLLACQFALHDTGGDGGAVAPVDPKTGQEIRMFLPKGVAAVVRVYDAKTGEPLRTVPPLEEPYFPPMRAALSPDGKYLARTGLGMGVKVWDLDTAKVACTLKERGGAVISLAFSPDGKRLAGGRWDGTVRVWNLPAGGEGVTLRGPGDRALGPTFSTSQVWGVAFSADSKRVAAASSDQTVRVWDMATGQEAFALKGQTSGVGEVAFSRDGTRLASLAEDGTAKVWAASAPEAVSFDGPLGGFVGLALSADGKQLAGGGVAGTVHVLDALTGRSLLDPKKHPAPIPIRALSFHPGGRYLAAGSGAGARVWELPEGREVLNFPGSRHAETRVAFSPDGTHLVTADDALRVWDTATWQEVRRPSLPVFATSLAFSPDGTRLAVGTVVGGSLFAGGPPPETVVYVLESGTFTVLHTLRGHRSLVEGVAFSPDGTRLATAAGLVIEVWDLSTGQPSFPLKGHTAPATGVAFHPKGSRLVSAGRDGCVRLWDLLTGQEILTLKGHTGAVWALAFNREGSRLVSSSEDGTVKVWDGTPGEDRPEPAADRVP
jgi:WD40 repeat protein